MDLSDLSVRVAATVTTNIDCGWVRSMQSAAKGGMTHRRDLLHCLLGRLAFRGHWEDLSHVSDSQVLSAELSGDVLCTSAGLAMDA